MKSKILLYCVSVCLSLILVRNAKAQGTAFTYQGRLNDGGAAANGFYDLSFSLYTASGGGSAAFGPQTSLATPVTNGLFTVTLDFGPGVFTGTSYWLQIAVRTNGGTAFASLNPRQLLTPTPYAVFASSTTNFNGIIPLANLPAAVLTNNAQNALLTGNFYGLFSGNGNSLTALNPANLGVGTAGINISGSASFLNGLSAASFWQLGGNNAGTGQFMGSTNNQPLEFRVNNNRALLLQADTSGQGSPNVIGGSLSNTVSAGVIGATIAGGGQTNYSLLEQGNQVKASYGTVGGGVFNVAAGQYATIAGGQQNTAGNIYATIAGGLENTANGQYAFAVGGGNQATNYYAAVPGGEGNIAGGIAAVAAAGFDNDAIGDHSFAAGYHSRATNSGAFVWADATGTPFYSTNDNTFNVRAFGGVVLQTAGAGLTLDSLPVFASSLGTSNNTAGGIAADIGGGQFNTAAANASFVGGGTSNLVQALGGTIGGGQSGTIQPGATDSTIGGGQRNLISSNAFDSTIAGGVNNIIETNSMESTIAGGGGNLIYPYAFSSTVGGGEGDIIFAGAAYSTIAGGSGNNIYAPYGTIAGGQGNIVENSATNGTISGGYENKAYFPGSFVGGGGYDGTVHTGNTAQGAAAVVGGGLANSAVGSYAAVLGGEGNLAGSTRATVGGGWGNNAAGPNCTVAGGAGNLVQGASSFIGGGSSNSVNAFYATVGAGCSNTATGPGAFVGGGGFDGTRISGNTAGAGAATIAGGLANNASGLGAFIGGGGYDPAGPSGNNASASDSVIAGGELNSVSSAGVDGTVGGGTDNSVFSPEATIAGGSGNVASGQFSTVGGGKENGANAVQSTVAGGAGNFAGAGSATVGGGTQNLIGSTGIGATIPGGSNNVANGPFSFAAGQEASALHQGTFVWADSQPGTFASTGNDEFIIRAQGGVGINTATPGANLGVNGTMVVSGFSEFSGAVDFFNTVSVSPGAGTLEVINDNGVVPGIVALGGAASGHARFRNALEIWPNQAATTAGYLDVRNTSGNPTITITGGDGGMNCSYLNADNVTAGTVVANTYTVSDRGMKKNFAPVNTEAALEKVVALPLMEWNYKAGDPFRHLGPMAQDFRAAFDLGMDDRHIGAIDEGGVALAAIQGLNEKLEADVKQRDVEIEALKKNNEALEKRLERLERLAEANR